VEKITILIVWRNLMKKIFCVGLSFLFLSMTMGCATKSENISANYVSPLQYQSYTCDQLRQELIRVKRKVLEVSGQQDHEATKDAVAFTVGMVLFWPALFFMIGKDKKAELSNLKGEYDAIENMAIQKNCELAREIQEERKKEKLTKEKKEKKQDQGSMPDAV